MRYALSAVLLLMPLQVRREDSSAALGPNDPNAAL
jgi:hypothetical protein